MSATGGSFAESVSRNWWALGLRGLAAVIFGILAFIWPSMALLTLVFIFGAYALANGIFALIAAYNAPKGYPRFGSLIFNGLISIAAGVLAFVWPGITAFSLLILIAAWAIVSGIMEIVTAIELRKVITNEWLMILAGLVSVLFGVVLLIQPAAGALALIWWIGAFAVIIGILLIALSFRMRRWEGVAPPSAGATPA